MMQGARRADSKKKADEGWSEPKIPLLDKVIVWGFIVLAITMPAIIVTIDAIQHKQ